MIKFERSLKNFLIVIMLLLMGGNISLLFAAGDEPLPQPVLNASPPTSPESTTNLSTQQQLIPQPNIESQQAAIVPPALPPLGVPPLAGQEDASQSTTEAAFNAMAKNALPMTPEQIQRLRQLFSASQLAASATPGTPPRPVATSQMVRLDPGATPPVIRLGQGFVSSLVFVDSTGAPWPIEAYDVGNPGAFNIQWDKKSNVLMIQSTSLYTYGNLAIRLKGLVTPVMLTLVPGQKAIDYRVDLRIPGNGPHAAPPPHGDGLPNSANTDLLGILDGVPPAGSKTLVVSGGAAQAWLSNEILFVRTRLTLLSPGWVSTMSSADGTKAYEMRKASTLLVSINGKVMPLKIEGF
ncbi:MAG: DotH/IcmK family type IV secretion protein [Gammaproteobacteria bacterium]